MSAITTHVLDTALGRPAQGVHVRLQRSDGGDGWVTLADATTDGNGRVSELVPHDGGPTTGVHRLRFLVGDYFAMTGRKGFFPYVDVVFDIADPAEHYHVPLLLSPFGYSTYRGS